MLNEIDSIIKLPCSIDTNNIIINDNILILSYNSNENDLIISTYIDVNEIREPNHNFTSKYFNKYSK